MVSHFINFSNLSGSSALLRAHGSGGARATIKIKAPQKNRALPEKQKGKKAAYAKASDGQKVGWGEACLPAGREFLPFCELE
ncbi:MAG: hypothetical protein KJ879_03260 [Nanoarchaeota archaeon]|nr:hypothetical protein [Nanoarchaeota archaeon]